LHQRLGVTTIYVTHDQIEAMTLADRVVVLNGGVVEQMGPPLELYDKPQTLFVAAFIGSPPMNFIDGRPDDKGRLVVDDELVLELPAPITGKDSVTIGVRPEHLHIADKGWPMIISVVEPTGSETQITGRIGERHIRVLVRGRTSAKPGETIHLHSDATDLHVFDTASGKRREIA